MRVVLDTSVLVAGLRSRRGASFKLFGLLRQGRFEVVLSVPMAFEYEAALVRHAEELALEQGEATGLVDYLCAVGHHQPVHFLWRPTLSDPNDECILEAAVAARAAAIVTHNVHDFRGSERFGVRALTPAAFLESLGEAR